MPQRGRCEMERTGESLDTRQNNPKRIKCLVWDLDNTLWDGVLLEGDPISSRDGVGDIIKTELLHEGGIN